MSSPIDPDFLEMCIEMTEPEISDSSSDDDVNSPKSRLTDYYPNAFSDTYGTVSGAPFVYKTGRPWPQSTGGPEIYPSLRETRPVHNHAITPLWHKLLKDIEAYLDSHCIQFTAITGFGFANAGEKVAFCQLLVTIGVRPDSLPFQEAKTAADHVKDILDQAGFYDIDVAVREWTTSLSCLGPNLPSLDPTVLDPDPEFKDILDEAGFYDIDAPVRECNTSLSCVGPKLPSLDPTVLDPDPEFHHPFTSTLGLSIASYKAPHYEGTVGLYLRRSSDSDEILALTAAHVACLPSNYPYSRPRRVCCPQCPDKIVALGYKSYGDALSKIMRRIGSLYRLVVIMEEKITSLEDEHEDRHLKRNPAAVSDALRRAKVNVSMMTKKITQLYSYRHRVATSLMITKDRLIGSVLHADPIGVSNGPVRFMVDWAVFQLDKDAFDWTTFKGNEVYIEDNLHEHEYRNLMYPNHSDREGYEHPPHGLLQIDGFVPEDEIRKPKQLNAHGDMAMPVIKHGSATGTTVGWVNGLKSLVRYDYDRAKYTALETTILPYGGFDGGRERGAFSGKGDSGATILDRAGRIVALLTGGVGSNNVTDVTFGTAWHDLEPHIRKTLPGCVVYSAVS